MNDESRLLLAVKVLIGVVLLASYCANIRTMFLQEHCAGGIVVRAVGVALPPVGALLGFCPVVCREEIE